MRNKRSKGIMGSADMLAGLGLGGEGDTATAPAEATGPAAARAAEGGPAIGKAHKPGALLSGSAAEFSAAAESGRPVSVGGWAEAIAAERGEALSAEEFDQVADRVAGSEGDTAAEREAMATGDTGPAEVMTGIGEAATAEAMGEALATEWAGLSQAERDHYGSAEARREALASHYGASVPAEYEAATRAAILGDTGPAEASGESTEDRIARLRAELATAEAEGGGDSMAAEAEAERADRAEGSATAPAYAEGGEVSADSGEAMAAAVAWADSQIARAEAATERRIGSRDDMRIALVAARLDARAFSDSIEIVGGWLWCGYTFNPDPATAKALTSAGWRRIHKRGKWAHNCGMKRKGRARGYTPKEKYGSIRVSRG